MFALDHRVPIIPRQRYAGAYARIPIDAADPRHGEALVSLDSVGVAFHGYHARTDGLNPPYGRPVPGSRSDGWLRASAAQRLVEANRFLEPHGHELLVLDAYRPIACQQGLWDFYWERARQELPTDATDQDLTRETRRYVADPRPFDPAQPSTWPAHTTGGAVDVSLRRLGETEPVDMGSRFEEITATSVAHHYEELLLQGRIEADDPRLWHRRLLHGAMEQAGWQNDPFVFWHHDWGNQLYIKVRRALHPDAPTGAWYGYVPPP